MKAFQKNIKNDCTILATAIISILTTSLVYISSNEDILGEHRRKIPCRLHRMSNTIIIPTEYKINEKYRGK